MSSKTAERPGQSQEYLDTILLNLPVGVAILEGPDFRYFRINQTLADLNGLPIDAHLGKTVAQVLPDAAPHILPDLRKVLKSGKPILNREFSATLPGGPKEVRHLIDFLFPIKIDGKAKAVGAVVLDITQRKQAEEEVKFLKEYNENIVANIPSAILIFDKNHKCISANRSFYQQWNKKIGSVEGKAVNNIFRDGPIWHKMLLQISKSNEIIEDAEVEYIKSTGKKKILNVKYVPLHKGNMDSGEYVMVIIDDITKKAKLQEELELTKEKLEKRTKRLKSRMTKRTDQLKNINNELEGLSLAKSEFMADVSHQLRTPLTIIRSNVDLALKNKKNKSAKISADHQAVLQDIGEEADNINKIISDLLILVKVDSGQLKLNFEPIALDGLIKKIYHQTKVLSDNREMVLKHIDQVNILGDENKVSQIVLNLLDNALKYTRPGDKIKISLYKKKRWAKVIIADTGQGIAEKDLTHIFERFYQADTNESKKTPGTGLGLAIAQNIAKMHGGDIEVKSQLDKGSKFSLYFPLVISDK